MAIETIGTLRKLERVLKEFFVNNPEAVQLDGLTSYKSNLKTCCKYKPSVLKYKINQDTRKTAIEELSRLCAEFKYDDDKVFVREGNLLKLSSASADAAGWNCVQC